jgi:hypothetical protein
MNTYMHLCLGSGFHIAWGISKISSSFIYIGATHPSTQRSLTLDNSEVIRVSREGQTQTNVLAEHTASHNYLRYL